MADSPLDSVKEAIAGAGAAKIIVALLVLAAIVGYVFFFPKAGSVVAAVRALDGDAVPGAEVTLTNDNGDVVASEYSDDGGVVRFKNVAPGTYSASVDAGAGYKPATKSVSLASGEEASSSIDVERISSVTLSAQENPSTLPLSCEKKVLFELRNSGQNDETAQLVGDGDLKSVFSAPQAVVAPAGNLNYVEGSFLVSNAKIGDSLKGKVRVKGTRAGVDFSFRIGGAPKVSVSPGVITGSAPPGALRRERIMVSNDGSEPLTISQQSIKVEGDYAANYQWIVFKESIAPGEQVVWWIALRVPSEAVGKLVGVITIPLPCKNVNIPIDTEVKGD